MGLLHAFDNFSLNHSVSYFLFVKIHNATRVPERGAFQQLLNLEFIILDQLNLDLKATGEPLGF